jgi:uncharacterized protein (TIGR02145 family)
VLSVTCPSFNPGAIATAGQSIFIGGTPATIMSTADATSDNGTISYQWYKNGNTINGATAASYTPPKSDAATAGVHTYTRRAKDNMCNTTFTPSAGNWVLTVTAGCHSAGATATFSNFSPCASSAYGATWPLTDDRDGKTYNVRYLPDDNYWMVQDLRYGGTIEDACVNRINFYGMYSFAPSHRFGIGTYGDCTNVRNSNTPAERGYLYDWPAALQSRNGCSGRGENANSCRGICPVGFHIPTGEEYSYANSSFVAFYRCDPPCAWLSWAYVKTGYASPAGTLNSTGVTGEYWTSSKTTGSGSDADFFYFADNLVSWSYLPAANGLAIRCVQNY